MVRLKELGYLKDLTMLKIFQFQNGTIKSLDDFRIIFNRKKFQFQNGTIKRGQCNQFNRVGIISIPKWYD